MYSSVFGLFFWFDFYSLICSCNDLSCIYCDFSFFCRFLILLILVVSLTTPVSLSTFSNNFPLLTTSSRDPVRLVQQNLRNFWECVPNINYFVFIQFLEIASVSDRSKVIAKPGMDPGGGLRGVVAPKIQFLKLSWEPSFYPEFYFTFVIIIFYFLISFLIPFLITIARWSF